MELSHTIRVVKGLPSEWGSCFRTVSLSRLPTALSCWENTIAVVFLGPDIIIFDIITGSQTAVISGHTRWVGCISFSSDGRSLVSGSYDMTVKLWDVQTGGVIKTFHGHNHYISSVAISEDNARITSGSGDWTICLWDVQTGECLHTIKQQDIVEYVIFSPTDPQHIVSISGGKVWKWDINSQKISSLYDATSLAFSTDYTQLALCHGEIISVQNLNSGKIIAQFDKTANHCCFSPDGKLLAAADSKTAYVWDITGPHCCLIETFVGHTDQIRALAFSSSSSLISASDDSSVKFWQIRALSKKQTATNPESPSTTMFPIQSVSLQARAGIAISSDLAGVVKTWDLSTGLCKTSIETPIGDCPWRDVQLIGSMLVIVWYKDSQINILDTNENKPLWTVNSPLVGLEGLRISGDGTKVFCLTNISIQAWSLDTGEHIGNMELDLKGSWYLDPLQMDDSRIWIQFENSPTQGWDFGTSSSSLIPPLIGSTGRPYLEYIGGASWQTRRSSWIEDNISGKEVFQLSGKHALSQAVQWDGQYLIAGYDSGELLILDFHHMYPK